MEAPGTAPGSATLIPSGVYRYSRQAGTANIGIPKGFLQGGRKCLFQRPPSIMENPIEMSRNVLKYPEMSCFCQKGAPKPALKPRTLITFARHPGNGISVGTNKKSSYSRCQRAWAITRTYMEHSLEESRGPAARFRAIANVCFRGVSGHCCSAGDNSGGYSPIPGSPLTIPALCPADGVG